MNKPRILIVDDEPVIRDLLSEDLGELGYSCEVAPDGENALRKMNNEEFSVVLLDIMLPGISGIDLLKEIKNNYDSAVIMITAADDVNTAVVSMKLGANDYILKPFNLDTLSTSINSVLEKNKIQTNRQNTNLSTNLTEAERDLYEMDAIARGIEAKLDLTDKRSSIVVKKTIEVARELGISDEHIKQWETKKEESDKKNKNTLDKLAHNPIAQTIMGVTEKLKPNYDPEKSSN